MRFGLLLAATLLTSSLARAEAPDLDGRGRMQAFRINGYELSGAEYWPFSGTAPFHYPADVLWGFYPEAVTNQAVDCAWIAYLDIQSYFRSDPARLRKAIWLGATNRFYLWVNDYSRAAASRSRRTHRLWHAAATSNDPEDYASGYWKWEATLAQDGTCLVPQMDQVAAAIDGAIRTLMTRPRVTKATGTTH